MFNFFYFPLGLGWLLGCVWISFLTKLPSLSTCLAINISILLLYIVILLNLSSLKKLKYFILLNYFIIFIFSLTLGISCSTYQSCKKLDWALKESQINQPIEVTGTITGLPIIDKDNNTVYFNFILQNLDLDTDKNKKQFKTNAKPIIRLFWKEFNPKIKPGDTLKLKVVLKPPHTLFNPGNFENEKQNFLMGIRAIGTVKACLAYYSASSASSINTAFNFFNLDNFRYELLKKIQSSLKQAQFKGIITALIIGEKTDVSSNQFQILQKTGTSHLIAISGLHVSMISGALLGLSVWLWRRDYKAYRRLHLISPQKIGALSAIIAAFMYAALAGWSVPTQRAFIMVSVAMLSFLLARKISPWFLYCMALVGVLLINPLATFNAGFWLSFLAVGSLLFAFGCWTYFKKDKIQIWLMPQWVAFIGLLPLLFLFFKSAPLVSPIANIVAIPVTSFLVVPLSLLGALLLIMMPDIPLGDTLLQLAHESWSLLWHYLETLSNLPFNVISKGYFTTSSIVLASLGCILLLMPKGLPGRYLGVIAWLPLLLGKPSMPILQNEVVFNLLEVGQGLSAVIQTKNHVLVYDTGPTMGSNDAGKQVIVPFLNSQAIHHINTVIISHSDLDHRGGLKSLIASYTPDTVLTPYPSKVTEIASRRCESGQRWQWDGVEFEVLSPTVNPESWRGSKLWVKNNNQSCVLKITTGNNNILLTGDIESIIESDLINHSRNKLKSRILVVPHHGSQSSSTLEFIKAVNPEYALFSTGYYNSFDFPRQSILERYQSIGAQTKITALHGMVQFRFNGQTQSLNPLCWRKKSEKFWNQV